jgi:hypothetical protein
MMAKTAYYNVWQNGQKNWAGHVERVERKLIHGQWVNVKICKTGPPKDEQVTPIERAGS